jgi:metallo-beta-lactamase class B
MKRTLFLALLTLTSLFGHAGGKFPEIRISNDLQLIRISEHAYVHVSYIPGENGRVPCNGLILVNKGKAFLFDTPNNDTTTDVLLDYISKTMKLEITGFLSNDWHWDSMGGLKAVQARGIRSYAHEMTRTVAAQKKLAVADQGFNDSMLLSLANMHIECYYFGPAHTMDNIVVWIPELRILFADCMVKELKAKDLGYTADGSAEAYPATLRKVKERFRNAKYVIPGHGAFGSTALIDHTLNMALKQQK